MAHRGGALLGDENSLATLPLALEAGADAVEVDLLQTACGALVLLHDPFLVAGGRQRWVRDLTVDDIEAINGRRPETHLALLDACRRLGLGLYAEVKAAGIDALDAFAADCARLDLTDQVCVGSFRADVVAHVARSSALDTSWLFADLFADPLAAARDLGCRYVHPCFDGHDAMVDHLAGPWMQRLWDDGRGVVSWNTTSEQLIGRFVDLGVAAVCTDDPAAVGRATGR